MSFLTILRQYASKTDPATLPPTVLFSHSTTTLTIFDAYPKATFHFLILPRVSPNCPSSALANLKSVLAWDKDKAKQCIRDLQSNALELRDKIEEEMMEKYGFKWDVWMGFHAVPSLEHLHLHVISSDLCAPALKNKKHYNSFHSKLGFFLHLNDVLEWFDATESHFKTMAKLEKSKYEPLLKDDLVCHRCYERQKNIPTLKTHLQSHFDKDVQKAKGKAILILKRKREDDESSDGRKDQAKKASVDQDKDS
ncbi:hypothetical protein SISNIDRAFT_448138 [Sistotremastrum niveocremeum HHB9708]|uniref:Aprataxin C2HE/C2H2/C2HC zinc finger domain-containing protein n=2 Tax=Sistotremastraceae TaxID=3402574 RepID=A0A165AM98_9AGAM|nr:hypothetical protein SISNIDRAFT_448138 [Sistotremastrum niveocremeum HHB9708]KZT42092.1 hypothetical protein SISSUDRAFT_1042031 [Sistotremastrum suecicum HHB10207 ss-3]